MPPNTIRRTCQCCARAIHANTGLIAHHGYQRPTGWGQQIGSCMGSRFAPFEASRDRLADLIVIIERELAAHNKRAAEIEAESIPLAFHYTTHGFERLPRFVEITRADFDDVRPAYLREMRQVSIHSFDDLKKRRAEETANRIKLTLRELGEQRQRFNRWQQTERWDGNAWEAVTVEEHA